MKNKALFSILFLSLSFYAQETEPIQTDRPDQTETPAIVPKGMFQVETGFSFQKNKQNNNTNTLPSTLWKYGVNENFELRLITEFISEKIEDRNLSGLNPILLGCKIKISDEKGIFPKTSFIGHLGAEWDGITPEATFIYTITTGYSFTDKLGSYIEFFGFAPEKDKANHSFDGGLTYLINNNFMLDLSSGIGITDNAPDHYVALGFSFRI